jgi:radical SAM superfamily enzyme YgiQ (UPF0313 family)
MKTLIINPPCEAGFDRSGRWPAKAIGGTVIEPLFLAYTAAVLEKQGLPVELIDCRPSYISTEMLLEKFDKNVILAVIQTATVSINQDLETAKKIKNKFPKTKIALVGSHVSVLDQEILENNQYIDFIAREEYEYTIRDLARALIDKTDLDNILGMTFRKNKEIVRNQNRPYIEDLDELPFPARHFLPLDKYFEPIFRSKRTLRLTGSRGCPFHCTFCLWTQTMFGRKARFRNPKKIVDEIEHLINIHQAKELYFEDDTFTLIPKQAIEVCNEILRRRIRIPWSCMSRVDTVNEEMLKRMKEAGCFMIRFGVESSSQEILNRVKKGTTIEQVVKAFKMTKKSGIEFHAAYTFGLPGETKETLEQTIKFAVRLNSEYAQFAIAMPFPGTELYQEAEKNGWLKANDWSDFEATENSVLEYPNLKAQEIVQAVKKAYRKFYFRPSYILKRACKVKSVNEFSQLVRGTVNLIKRSFFNIQKINGLKDKQYGKN